MDSSNGTHYASNGHDGINGDGKLFSGGFINNGFFSVSFGLAPGAERFHSTNGTNGLAPTPPATESNGQSNNAPRIMDYSVDFPQLPDAPIAAKPVASVWGSAVRSTTVTAKLTFNASERASKLGKRLGDMSEEQQKCNSIAKDTNVKIELSESRDQSLTILITGKQQQVEEARTRLLRELQTQANHEIHVPKEFRGALIGKEGSNLRKIEQDYSVKIFMPNRSENSDAIRIHGPPEFVSKAVRFIENKVTELSRQATETLHIPRAFYSWIRGPGGENIERWQSQYNVKVNIPPPAAEKETIVVHGEREGVHKVAAEVQRVYDSKVIFI